MEQDRRNPEEEAGGYGTPTVEQEMGGLVEQDRTATPDVDVPSADAEMDEGNTDAAAKERDGGASGLPNEKAPRDDEDEGERFDAG